MVDSTRHSEAPVTIGPADQPPALHFDIQVARTSDEPLRWTCGSRLNMEKPFFIRATDLAHPALGTLATVGETADLLDVQLSDVGAVRVEIDLEPHDAPRRSSPEADEDQRRIAALLAAWAWGGDAERLADLALQRPTADNSSDQPQAPEDLRRRGWSVTDMWLLTSVSPMLVQDRTPWCVRPVRVVHGEAGALMVWHPIADDHHWDPRQRLAPGQIHPFALPECRRRHGQLTTVTGNSGTDETARLVQDIMQHHDWTEWQLTQRVEHWERQFFALARDGAFDAHLDARHLGAALDETHRLLGLLRRVNRDLARRARLGWLPSPAVTPEEENVTSLELEVKHRTGRMEARLDHLNTSLREGWTLLSSAAAGARLELDRATSERTQGFQNAAGLVAALVLVPGLVLSLYGAEVEGLPGMGSTFGLVAMLAYAGVGALATFSTLRAMAYRRRPVAIGILLGGAVAVVLTTVLLLTLGWDT